MAILIGISVILIGPETIFFSKDTKIGKNVTIEPYVVIGSNVNDQNLSDVQFSPIFEYLEKINCPILVGISRKSMIYNVINSNPKSALNGTTVLNTFSLMKGANIIRVHDVKEAKECVSLWEYLH